MAHKGLQSNEKISSDQLNLIERFLAAYNEIDQYLRRVFKSLHYKPFSYLVRSYAKEYHHWRDDAQLLLFADLRNIIIHAKTAPYRYAAIPSPYVIESIEEIRDRLINPPPVLGRVPNNVVTVSLTDPLMKVLDLINRNAFSQFPVYEAEKFRGLLTENGLARLLANHAHHNLSVIELGDVLVETVLGEEEKRQNCDFVPRKATVDEVVSKFRQNVALEAVLITEDGKRDEKPLGIATAWDMLRLAELSGD